MSGFPILILAAGQSSRMRGADKLLEDVGGMPLLRRQVKMAAATGAPVYVALGPEQQSRRAVIDDLGATIIETADAHEGMGGTLRGAVPHLPECTAFMVVPADLVALQTEHLKTVLDAARHDDTDHLIWRGATQDGAPGHPIVFSNALRQEFVALSGDTGGAPVVKRHADATCLVTLPDEVARLDLDTPEDWALWRSSSS